MRQTPKTDDILDELDERWMELKGAIQRYLSLRDYDKPYEAQGIYLSRRCKEDPSDCWHTPQCPQKRRLKEEDGMSKEKLLQKLLDKFSVEAAKQIRESNESPGLHETRLLYRHGAAQWYKAQQIVREMIRELEEK